MKIKKGDLLKSYLDGQLYTVREVGHRQVILVNQHGSDQAWLGGWELEGFFAQIEALDYHLGTGS